jgi:hypothetical protein
LKKTQIDEISKNFDFFDVLKDFCNGEELWSKTDNSQELTLLPYLNFHHEFIKQHFCYLPLIIEIYIVSGKSNLSKSFLCIMSN